MTPSPTEGSGDSERVVRDEGSPPGLPRWLKVSGIVVILLILLALAASFVFGIQHGPRLHAPTGDAAETAMSHAEGHQEGDVAPIDGAPELAISAGDLRFDPARIELTAGEAVNFALSSEDTAHDHGRPRGA
ncbi:MAG: hypothetical protein LC808_06600 [Actinobacteria bacterium]|nr:hypothetical protein [Actinomycetota bacterium]